MRRARSLAFDVLFSSLRRLLSFVFGSERDSERVKKKLSQRLSPHLSHLHYSSPFAPLQRRALLLVAFRFYRFLSPAQVITRLLSVLELTWEECLRKGEEQ